MPSSPAPGTLHLVRAQPNPHGAADAALFLCVGDAISAPITQIIPGPEAEIPPSRLPLDRPFRLKLLHFNDLHGHVACFTADEPLPLFSRIAGLLRVIRRQYAHNPHVAVLAISGGDEFGGAIFDELLGEDPAGFQAHAAYRLYTQAGVDAAALGNHDFDKGPELLAHAISHDAGFPILAANVQCRPDITPFHFPAALFVIKGIRAGFIGLLTPAQLHPEIGDRVRVADPVQTARNLIPALRPLCDVLIILSHLGHSLHGSGAATAMAGDVELAAALAPGDVHLIIGAHTHDALNERGLDPDCIVNGIPIVQAGKLGQFVGEVDITIGHAACVTHARLTAAADLPVDKVFEQAHVRPLLDLAHPHWNRVLGQVIDDESLCTDAVRNEFAAGESSLANFIADGLAAQSRDQGYAVDFAMIDAANVRSGLQPGGVITFGDWFNLMPFADTLCLLRLSGRQVAALLHDNALRVDRPAAAHTERGFLHFSRELRYTIHLGANRGDALARDITIAGQPPESWLDQEFIVAAGSFVRGPAAAWHAQKQPLYPDRLLDLRQFRQTPTHHYIRNLLVAHILAHGGVTEAGGAKKDGRVRVVGI